MRLTLVIWRSILPAAGHTLFRATTISGRLSAVMMMMMTLTMLLRPLVVCVPITNIGACSVSVIRVATIWLLYAAAGSNGAYGPPTVAVVFV